MSARPKPGRSRVGTSEGHGLTACPSPEDRWLADLVLEYADQLHALPVDDAQLRLVETTMRRLDLSEREVVELGVEPQGVPQLRDAALRVLARRLARIRLQL